MINPRPHPIHEGETIVLSKDVRPGDPFAPIQVTIADLDDVTPAVSLYRFTNGEEVQCLELNGAEMKKLIEAYTAKYYSAKADLSPALQLAISRLEYASGSACPDLVASSVPHDLLRALSSQFLAPEHQAQLKTVLERAASSVAQQSRAKEK